MKISKLLSERIKETPNGVNTKGNEYLVRGGFIKQVYSGIYSLLPPAMRVQQKIVNIIREEMNKVDGQEVLFPVLMPSELWQESGRYSSIGNEMFRLKDRTGHNMVLGMTHEEASVQMARNIAKSYDQLPFMIYQFQTKLRDEPRARAGLIRVKEFTMKDAYSFHESYEDLQKYYDRMHDAYVRIFKRIGMKRVICVESDSGMMGGNKSNEFMLLNEVGEDTLAVCDHCDYEANSEIAECVTTKFDKQELPLEEIDTKDAKTIEDICEMFGVKSVDCCKAVVLYAVNTKQYVVIFVRGDLEVNPIKVRNVLKQEVVEAEIDKKSGLNVGNIGPKDLPENVIVLVDKSLDGCKNTIVGANKPNYHLVNFSFERDVKVDKFYDLATIYDGQICPKCKTGKIILSRGVEVGQIFQLGTKYTETMNMKVHDRNGKEFNPIMGCYGIGVGRALACVAEESHDDKGIIWPISIAPWQIILSALRMSDEKVAETANDLYNVLSQKYEVLFDDRDCSTGVKFADSELMGIPVRVVVSPRSLQENMVEITIRSTKETQMVKIEDLRTKLDEIIKNLYSELE